MAVPPGVVTDHLYEPRKCRFGTVAVIFVDELTVKVAAVPPSFTEVAPVKFVPVIVTCVRANPNVGVNPLIVGAPPPPPLPVTVKLAELVPVPEPFDTEIFPVVAPLGTVAVMLVDELTV